MVGDIEVEREVDRNEFTVDSDSSVLRIAIASNKVNNKKAQAQ